MFQVLENTPHGFRSALGFLLRRIFRIFPAYWFFLALTGFFILSGFVTFDHAKDAHPRWLEGWTLLSRQSEPSLPIRVAWSLIYEMLFYYVLFLFVWNRGIGLLCLAAYFAFSLVLNHWSPVHLYGLDPLNALFLSGLVLGAINRHYSHIFPRLIPLISIGIAAALAYIFLGWSRNILILGSPFIVAGILGFEHTSPPRRHGILPCTLQFLGTVSFSIDVGHILTQSALHYIVGDTTLLTFPLFVGAPVLVAYLSFTLVEKPGMNFAKWFDSRYIIHRPVELVSATKELELTRDPQ